MTAHNYTGMQEESAVTSSDRLKRLRLHSQLNWDAVAERIGISTSMLYQVLRGDRELSDKAKWRLEFAEQEAGVPAGRLGRPIPNIKFSALTEIDIEQQKKQISEYRTLAKEHREVAERGIAFAEELERQADLMQNQLNRFYAVRSLKARRNRSKSE